MAKMRDTLNESQAFSQRPSINVSQNHQPKSSKRRQVKFNQGGDNDSSRTKNSGINFKHKQQDKTKQRLDGLLGPTINSAKEGSTTKGDSPKKSRDKDKGKLQGKQKAIKEEAWEDETDGEEDNDPLKTKEQIMEEKA